MIPAGVRTSFDVVGVAGGWIPVTVDDVRSAAIAELAPFFSVHNVVIQNTGAGYEVLEWPFLATVNVSPIQGFATFEDAASVVTHAFYQATGNMPSVTGLGQGQIPEPGGGWLPDIGGGLGNLGQSIKDLFGGVQDTTNLLLILTAGVLIALVVSAGGKTTRIGLG